jgi:methylmalonyl-CoA mutase C-terminal domain/subunit
MKQPKRILIAKIGLDGHNRGAKIVARALADAGFEVIYTGLRQTPEQIVSAAIQEQVDAVGLSILSGVHMRAFSRVLQLLRKDNANEVQVFGGGIIPHADRVELKRNGVREIFGPGTPLLQVVNFVKEMLNTNK